MHEIVALIDPIDGTKNYYDGCLYYDIEKYTNWGISVGILKNGVVNAGIIYQPEKRRIYFAERGKGAFVNGNKVHTSSTIVPVQGRLIYSPPYPKDTQAFIASQRVIKRIETEIPMTTTTLGSQVIETMQVAEGHQDAFIHLKTKPWDIAAAIAIVTEAGGKVYTAEGNHYDLFGETILLTNGILDISSIITIASEELRKIA